MHEFWDTGFVKRESAMLDGWDKLSEEEKILRCMEEFPQSVPYLVTTAEGMVGMHDVYFRRVFLDDEEHIKIGYSKDADKRFNEKRYRGADRVELGKYVRKIELQALGATSFEGFMKYEIECRSISPHLIDGIDMPGKTEIFEVCHLDTFIKLWDENIERFKNLRGFKTPN